MKITTGTSSEPARTGRRVFIVVPAYNEGTCIRQVISNLKAYYPRIVVVDDGSCDDTAREATAAGAVVLRHVINRGQGASVQTGVRYCLQNGADIIVTFDGDGQHQPEDIAALVGFVADGEADIAIGSRFLGHTENMPLTRRVVLKAGIIYTYILHGLKLTDTHNGLRAFSRRAAGKLHIRMDRMAHADEILDQVRRHNLHLVEVPVRVVYTEYSLNKGQHSWNVFSVITEFLLGKIFR